MLSCNFKSRSLSELWYLLNQDGKINWQQVTPSRLIVHWINLRSSCETFSKFEVFTISYWNMHICGRCRAQDFQVWTWNSWACWTLFSAKIKLNLQNQPWSGENYLIPKNSKCARIEQDAFWRNRIGQSENFGFGKNQGQIPLILPVVVPGFQ